MQCYSGLIKGGPLRAVSAICFSGNIDVLEII